MMMKKLVSLASAGLMAAAMPALAQDAALAPYVYEKAVHGGDIAWMSISTVLVLLMTVPGLALFYGGLVRTKNMLSMLTQVFAISAVVCIIWVTYGYSMAFSYGGALDTYVGGFSKAFLQGVDATTLVPTFTNGVWLPEYTFIAFQMTFAMITPAPIVGAFAERMKFSAMLWFSGLWLILVYMPICHWIWGSGWLAQLGVKDLAGGICDSCQGRASRLSCSESVRQSPRFSNLSYAATQYDHGRDGGRDVMVWLVWL